MSTYITVSMEYFQVPTRQVNGAQNRECYDPEGSVEVRHENPLEDRPVPLLVLGQVRTQLEPDSRIMW